MKTNLSLFFSISLMLAGSEHFARSQGFVNLDFESPNLPLTPVDVPTADALPGWTAYTYGFPSSNVIYNTLSLGAAAVSLQGPGSLEPILQGSYSVILQPSSAGPPGVAEIGQTAQIPQNARSLTFYSSPGSGFQVTLGGQSISLVQIASTPSYNIMGGDISAYADQTDDLRFSGGGELDNIQFSVSPVPEPGTLALFATGALLLAIRRRQHSMP